MYNGLIFKGFSVYSYLIFFFCHFGLSAQITSVVAIIMLGNGLWYGVVQDYEAISYQFTPTFFTSHKRSHTSKTRIHYTMCWHFVHYSSPFNRLTSLSKSDV